MSVDVAVFLQNAWKRGAQPGQREWYPGKPEHSRRGHEWATWRSRSGQRLKTMLPDGMSVALTNASPFIGSESSSFFPLDREHVVAELHYLKPRVLLLCGAEAQKITALTDLPAVCTFHPAYRLLTNAECARVKTMLQKLLEVPAWA